MTRISLCPDTRTPAQRSTARGQLGVIGVLIIVAIVVLGMIAIVTVGGPAVSDTQDRIAISAAEHSLSSLDSQASSVAFGDDGTGVQRVNLGGTADEGAVSTTDESWIRVDMINATTGAVDTAVVHETRMGTVVYRNGDTTVGYEGGGVWRGKRDASTLISPPEFHFRNGTLTLPILSIEGDPTLTRNVQVRRQGHPDRRYPDADRNLTNRVPDGKVAVTVHSNYYQAWGRYFERSTNGHVRYDHGARTATVTFLALPNWIGLDTGIIATSGDGEVRLGGNSIYIDSYNSGQGTGRYTDTQSANGTVTAANDVVATGSSNVQGDIRSGAVVDLSGTTNIHGTVYWTDAYEPDGASVNGGDEQINGVPNLEPITGYVENTVAEVRQSNDNANVTAIAGNELTGSDTLPAGTYYLEDMAIESGDTLNIDTTGGDVTIAVEDTVSIIGKGTSSSKAAEINVIGDGTVTVFVRGDDPVDFEVGKNGKVNVPDERSGQFRVYGTQDFDAVITSDKSPAEIRFEGVIYAPAGYPGTGSVVIGQAKYFGAIVTGNLTVKQGAEIHYDQGLANEQFPRSPAVSRIEFLHVGIHNVTITN